MHCNFFIHSSVDGHIGCFHVLAIVNSIAMNIGVHVSFSTVVSAGYLPVVGVWGHIVVLFLVFKGISMVFCIVVYQFTFPLTEQQGSFYSTSSPAFIVCRLFDDGHSDQCEMIPHCSFDLHITNNE